MSDSQVRELLEREIKKAGSAMAFARMHGISTQFLCDVRKQRRGLTTRVLEALGLVAFIDYRKMKPAIEEAQR